jgi:hypothetical protein
MLRGKFTASRAGVIAAAPTPRNRYCCAGRTLPGKGAKRRGRPILGGCRVAKLSANLHPGVTKSFSCAPKLVGGTALLLLSHRTIPNPQTKGTSPMSHDQTHAGEPARTASQLTESLAQTAHTQRALLQEISSFARGESLRFFNLRLERNEAALEKMQHCVGLPGLIGVQQEWLRDFVTDVIGQNMRLAGVLRGVTHDTLATAGAAARDTVDATQAAAHQAEQQFHDSAAEAHTHPVDDAQTYSDIQH